MKLCRRLSALLILAAAVQPSFAETTRYWDTDTTDQAGAGGSTPGGTWDTAAMANWNISSDGTGVPGAWNSGDDAVFAAGTDATGAYTVNVSGT